MPRRSTKIGCRYICNAQLTAKSDCTKTISSTQRARNDSCRYELAMAGTEHSAGDEHSSYCVPRWNAKKPLLIFLPRRCHLGLPQRPSYCPRRCAAPDIYRYGVNIAFRSARAGERDRGRSADGRGVPRPSCGGGQCGVVPKLRGVAAACHAGCGRG